MPTPAVRPATVALLVGLDLNGSLDPRNWTHPGGQPLTADELATALDATFPEIQAVTDYLRRAEEHTREQADAIKRIGTIAQPYLAQLPKGSPMRDAMALMTPAELAETRQLMDLVAPDGTVAIPRNRN